MKTKYLLGISFLASIVLGAIFLCAPNVDAQRTLQLKPDGTIDQPTNYLAANRLSASLAKTGINAKTTATTNITPAILSGQSFYPDSIQVVTTSVSGISGGATVTVGSTGTATNSILTSQALSSSPTLNGIETFLPTAEAKALLGGETLTFTVGTGATGTSQTVAVYVTGHYGEPSLSPTPTPTATATATATATPTASP